MPEHFHFLHPSWFLLLIPMLIMLWWLPRVLRNESSWQQACETHLLPFLLNKPVQALSQLPLWLLAAGWVVTVFALADPAWHKQAQAVYRNQDAAVIILDLSQSMLSSDLTPSRLERARFKVEDILKKRKEGQTGLIVFAGDAFTVSPLTTDTRTIQSLLEPLTPNLMPVQGSRVDLAIKKAAELLRQAGQKYGNIILLTDGYSNANTPQVAANVKRQGYRISVLGVGSDKPSPIPDKNGDFIRDAKGNIVMAALNEQKLQALANAGGGHYHSITVNNADLDDVLSAQNNMLRSKMNRTFNRTGQETDKWQSQGPYLLLLLLPLGALAFRRGWLLVLPLVLIMTTTMAPQPAEASGWDNLWLRPDQQAEHALHSGDYKTAKQVAKDPMQHGEAAYRSGDFKQALHDFSLNNTPAADYNRGNTLARLGRYKEAISAYDSALKKNSTMKDALHNKKEIEKLLKKQNKQNKKDQKNSSNTSKKSKPEKSSDKNSSSDKNTGKNNRGEQKKQGNKSTAKADNKNEQQENDNEKNKADKKNNSTKQQANNEKLTKDNKPGNKNTGKNNSDNSQNKDEQLARNKNKGKDRQALAHGTRKTEQQQADERWLRRIPDDPGGLLRRKFRYQYSQRATKAETEQNAW